MIRLYDYPSSPRARKVRTVLKAKQLEYDTVVIDVLKGEQKCAAYLRVNPQGKVPALVHNETVLYESSVIMEYLEDTFDEPPLLPEEPGARAHARVLLHYADNPYDTAMRMLAEEIIFKPARKERTVRAVVAEAREKLRNCFGHISRELGTQKFVAGPLLTLADISYVSWLPLFEPMRVDIPHANIRAWFERLRNETCVKTAG